MKEWLVKIGLALLSITAPVHDILIATMVVILIDLITGLWKALKIKEKIVKSAAMRRTISKIAVYNLAILSAFTIEMFLLSDMPLVKLVSAVIGLVEIKSILENLNEITGADIFKQLLSKLGSDNDKKDS